MSTEASRPIPIPLRQRWRDARLRVLPMVVFVAALCAIACLWQDHVSVRAIVGQAEPVLSNASSYKAGVLAELSVTRFQKVKAGDAIGKVLVTDPRVLASSLALIQAEIDSLQANMKPVMVQQHNAMDYDQLRLNWMKERAQLATSRVNLDLAEAEYHRMAELFRDQIVAQRVYEQAKAARDRLQNEVDNLTKLVQEGEESFNKLQLTNSPQISQVSENPLRAAIAVQESKLRLTEAELSPVTVRAPIDGLVSTIFHRAGESVTAGQPIVAVATLNPVRIIGYVLPPIIDEPKAGMAVEVRKRGLRNRSGLAKIVEVGTQLESVPPTLLGPVKFANTELGLPVEVSLPQNLNIRAGELVEIVFSPKSHN
jgi:multidrug resistance efflux pump